MAPFTSTAHLDEGGELCCDAMFTIGLFDLEARRLIRPTPEWAKALGLRLEDLAAAGGGGQWEGRSWRDDE